MFRLPELDTTPVWNPREEPPALVCPRRFCFNFLASGNRYAPGLHQDLESALALAKPVSGDHCKGWFGRCRRLGDGTGTHDFYEPCEPELHRAGLPDDYFRKFPSSSEPVE